MTQVVGGVKGAVVILRLMRRPSRQRFSVLLIAACAVVLPAGARPPGDVPEPATGHWAETILSLLHYNREVCDSIAGKVVNYWGSLAASPEAELEAVRQFVVDRELSNLASGRAASDIVEGFLPGVQEEANQETVAALKRLHEMEIELCDTVAFPNASRQAFEGELQQILDKIEREEAELGRLLVVPPKVLESAIGPYLGRIQIAGVEAEGEYRDYLDSLKPPPTLPTRQDLMEAWHRRYTPAVRPAKEALGRYLTGRRTNDSQLIRSACREILGAVIPLLRNDRIFHAPEETVYKPLQRAFFELQKMAGECSAGRSREMETHYRAMQQQLAAASQVLAEFSLKP